MVLNFKQVALASALMMIAAPLLAKDVALVIGNGTYSHQPQTQDAMQVRSVKSALEAAGFEVIYGENQTKSELIKLASEFVSAAPDADHLVVVLSGQIASSQRDSWLLATDGQTPNSLTIGDVGLSMGGLMDALTQKSGASLMAVGETTGDTVLGDWLVPSADGLTAATGVTLVRGPALDVMQFLKQSALKRGQVMGPAPAGIAVSGRTPLLEPFLPMIEPAAKGSVDPADRAYWKAVRDIGTIAAITTYVERYPDGHFLDNANRAIEKLRANTPLMRAKEGEKRLELNRQDRRQIQRNLAMLEFDPRGIDGLFGPNTRAAIGAWQASIGRESTGYLKGKQITALHSAAEARAKTLEAEARRRQKEEERKDRTYWSQTGQDGTETSLRTYLKRYPDGVFAEVAQKQIVRFENERSAKAAAAERKYWVEVRADGSAKAYRSYLKKYPNGAFAPTATANLADLEEYDGKFEMIRAARAEETRVASSVETRFFVERKLHDLGLNPGTVDGEFDDKTRRAMRKFQRARQLPVSGHATQQTIVRLMAAR